MTVRRPNRSPTDVLPCLGIELLLGDTPLDCAHSRGGSLCPDDTGPGWGIVRLMDGDHLDDDLDGALRMVGLLVMLFGLLVLALICIVSWFWLKLSGLIP